MTELVKGPARATRRPARIASGFTLLELMVTLLVVGLLLGVGVPGFFEIIRSNRAATNANELVTALAIARSEAIRRGTTIGFCGTSDPAATPVACDGTWTDPWIVFVDSSPTAASPDPGEILREWPAPLGGGTVSTGAGWIRFLSRGEAQSDAAMPLTLTLEIEDCSDMQGRDVQLNAVGRTSVEAVAC